jgi:hypothetical protein
VALRRARSTGQARPSLTSAPVAVVRRAIPDRRPPDGQPSGGAGHRRARRAWGEGRPRTEPRRCAGECSPEGHLSAIGVLPGQPIGTASAHDPTSRLWIGQRHVREIAASSRTGSAPAAWTGRRRRRAHSRLRVPTEGAHRPRRSGRRRPGRGQPRSRGRGLRAGARSMYARDGWSGFDDQPGATRTARDASDGGRRAVTKRLTGRRPSGVAMSGERGSTSRRITRLLHSARLCPAPDRG